MKKHAAPIIAAVLLLLPVLYVGSYLALVVPGGYINGRLNISTTIHPPNYRVCDKWAKAAFWPLEQIDRKLRPEVWETAEVLHDLLYNNHPELVGHGFFQGETRTSQGDLSPK